MSLVFPSATVVREPLLPLRAAGLAREIHFVARIGQFQPASAKESVPGRGGVCCGVCCSSGGGGRCGRADGRGQTRAAESVNDQRSQRQKDNVLVGVNRGFEC